MSQAFEIDTLDFFFWYAHPLQKSSGFEAKVSTYDETGSESAIETMITPPLVGDFDSASLSTIC